MYGDSDVMRRHVDRLREQGTDIRSMADHLVGQLEALAWTGRAADTMRDRVRDRATQLRAAASQHDSAADSLEKHLEEVELTKDSIAGAERQARGLTERELADLELPAPGHLDWLTVELPRHAAGL